MDEPQKLELAMSPPVSHDPGVTDQEGEIARTRWALVEYSPGSSRRDWCDTPHSGYVVAGAITYHFEDGRDPLTISAGEAFVLPTAPRHRGYNEHEEPARIFIIDALPEA
jgi:quercetin dioxygenase-like cupin family protein